MPTLAENRQAENRDAKPSRAQGLCKTIAQQVERLACAVDGVRASAQFKAYLDTQARFHKYSWGNTMLIAAQCPSATQVAGYRTWQKLGRQVRKGERSISILAPMTYKTTDKKTGEETTRLFFRAVSVFDIAQTDGEALPTVKCHDIEASADGLLADLGQVATKRGLILTFKPIDGGAYGCSKRGAIDIDNTHSTGQQAKTLAHELAHETLHWADNKVSRSIAELEAESVAYVVCAHFNLPTEVRSSAYIAIWDGDGKALRASLERISKTARAIIDDALAVATDKAVA